MPHKLDKTEASVFTLLSLYILMNQEIESLFGQEDILKSEFDADNSSFQDMLNDTIHEALVYQILLKACAYIDECNDVFGVQTEGKDKDQIMFIKQITKLASRAVTE